MNRDLLKGNLLQVKGLAKVWWGRLTDDDLEKVGVEIDKIIGLIQEKYGYTSEQAQQEFNQRIAEYEASLIEKAG
jgi:uncharacterized protein YjbJ (UPF0337 family)